MSGGEEVCSSSVGSMTATSWSFTGAEVGGLDGSGGGGDDDDGGVDMACLLCATFEWWWWGLRGTKQRRVVHYKQQTSRDGDAVVDDKMEISIRR